jgi:hypothetical protein
VIFGENDSGTIHRYKHLKHNFDSVISATKSLKQKNFWDFVLWWLKKI